MGKRGETAAATETAAQDTKASANGAPKKPASTKPKGDGEAKGAARPRKWDYGITPEAQITRIAEGEVNVKKDIEKSWVATEGNPTVAQFMSKGGDRHGLRVLSRRHLISLTHADGTVYPIQLSGETAVAPEAPAE